MSTNEPMTPKQLDAIQERVNVILARLDAMTVNDSWWSYPLPDPTDERIKELEKENAELRKQLTVDDAMVKRGAFALARRRSEDPLARDRVVGHTLLVDAKAALDAALNPEGEK